MVDIYYARMIMGERARGDCMKSNIFLAKKSLFYIVSALAFVAIIVASVVFATSFYKINTPVANAEESTFTALADADLGIAEAEINATFTRRGEATFNANPSRAGATLIGITATYPEEIEGAGEIKVSLERVGTTNTYRLYGIRNNFTLSGEWVSKTINVTWDITNVVVSNHDGSAFDINTPVYYGIGLSAIDMPYAKSKSTEKRFDKWLVSATYANGTTDDELNYIPANAISATCKGEIENHAPYVIEKAYDFGTTTYNKVNSGMKLVSGNSALKTGNISATLSNVNNTGKSLTLNGFGFYKTSAASGSFFNGGMLFPIRLEGAVRSSLKSGRLNYVDVRIQATVDLAVYNGQSPSGYMARSLVLFAAEVGQPVNLDTYTTYQSYSKVAQGDTSSEVLNSPYQMKSTTPHSYWEHTRVTIDETVRTDTHDANTITTGFRAVSYSREGNANVQTYACISSLSYTVIEVESGRAQTFNVNLNSNDSTGEEISSASLENTSLGIVDSPWQRDGYNFVGWNTDENATTGDKNLSIDRAEEGATYYAIWEKKNYPYMAYDVYTDGTNIARVAREEEYGIYAHDTDVTIPTAESGGNSYLGFATGDDVLIKNISPGVISDDSTWSAVTYDGNQQLTVSGALVLAYIRQMDAPIISNLNSQEVTYGTPIDLDVVSLTHGAQAENGYGATLTYDWLYSGDDSAVDFVDEDKHVLYNVAESNNYKLVLNAEVIIVDYLGETIALTTSTNSTYDFVINKRTLEFSWSETDFTYTGENYVVEAVFTNLVGTDDAGLVYEDNNKVNAGEYTATITGLTNDNYTLPAEGLSVDWVIAKQELTIDKWVVTNGGATTDDLIYNGNEYVVTVAILGAVNGETPTIDYQNNTKIVAGSFEVTASLNASESNYTFTTTSKEFVVLKRTLSLEWPSASYVYDGEQKIVNATLVNAVESDNLTLNHQNARGTNATSYTTSVAITGNNIDSYNLADGTLTATFDWVISPRPITASWQDVDSYVYNGKYQYPTLMLDGFVQTDTVHIATTFEGREGTKWTQFNSGTSHNVSTTSGARFACETIDAGSYTLSFDGKIYADAGGTVNTNYVLDGAIYKTYTINKSTINGTGVWKYTLGSNTAKTYTAGALVYCGDTYTLSTTFDSSALWSRDDTGARDIMPTANYVCNQGVDALTYNLSATLDSTNYQVGENATLEWSIAPLEVEIDWVGGSFTYDKEEKTVSANITNIVGSDVVGLVIDGNTGINANGYQASVTALNGDDKANYALPATTPTFDWTIAPLVVDIAWAVETLTYNGEQQGISASISNKIDTDDVTLVLLDNTATLAKGYTAKVSALDGVDKANYALPATTPTQEWSIAKRVIDIAWEVGTLTYNGLEQSISASVANKVGSDDVTFVITGNTAIDALPSYNARITGVEGADISNYALPTEGREQSWSIAPLTITLGWALDNYTYDGNTKYASANISNLISGDIVALEYQDNAQTNAGDYNAKVVGIVGTDSSNYVLPATGLDHAWKINKRVVTIEWQLNGTNSYAVVFDGTERNMVAVLGNIVGADIVNVEYSGTTKATQIGTYSTTATALSNPNYALPAEGLSQSWSIDELILGIDFVSSALTYNGESQGVVAVVSNILAKDIDAISFETTGSIADTITTEVKEGKYYIYFNATNAGDYKAVVGAIQGIDDGVDYGMPDNTTLDWSIAKANIVGVEFGGATYTYAKTTYALEVSSLTSQYGDSLSVTYTGGESNTNTALNAGTYNISASVDGGSNYNALTLSATLVIDIATIEGITLQSKDVVYNGENQASLISKNFTQFDEEVQVSYAIKKGGEAVDEVIVVGSYDITANITAGDNYDALTLNATVVVGKRTIKVQRWVYTNGSTNGVVGQDSTVYNGVTYELGAELQNVVSTDTLTLSYSGNINTNAGNYTAKLLGVNDDNYTLSTENDTISWVIARADISGVTLESKEVTYSGAPNTIEANTTKTQYNDDIDIAYTISKDSQAVDSAVVVGEYTITASLNAGSNYNKSTLIATLTIKALTLSIEWQVGELIYDGTLQGITAVITNVIGTDDVALHLENNENHFAGDYVASIVSIVGDDNFNYALPTDGLSQSWSIAKRVLNITWAGGDFTYDGTQKSVSATITNLVEGNQVDLVLSNDSAVDAGSYTAEITSFVDGSGTNYTLPTTGLTYDYNIATRVAVVEWVVSTLTYNGEEQGINANVSNKVGADDVSFVLDEGKATNAGNYTAEVVGLVGAKSSNYSLPTDNLTKEWSIAKRVIAIVWIEQELTYNGKEQSINATFSNIVAGEEVELNYTGNTATNAGNYTATATFAREEQNYILSSSSSIDWSIAKRGITIVGWSDGTNSYSVSGTIALTYAKDAYTLTPVADDGNIIPGDEANINMVVSGNVGANVGTYTATASLEDNDNYEMLNATKDWSIIAKELIVVWSKQGAFDYNGKEQGISVSLSGIIDGDIVNATTTNLTATDAGSYTAKVVSIDNTSYTLPDYGLSYTWTINKVAIKGVTMLDLVIMENSVEELEITKLLDTTKTQFGDKFSASLKIVNEDNSVATDALVTAGFYQMVATLTAGSNYKDTTITANLTVKAVVIADEVEDGGNANIMIETDGGFTPDIKMESTITTYENTERPSIGVTLDGKDRVAVVYNLRLMKGQTEVEQEGEYSVKLLVPEALLGRDFTVVSLTENGEEAVEYTMDGNYALISTEELTTFVIVYQLTTAEYLKQIAGWLALAVGVCVVLLIIMLIVAFYKKSRTINFVTSGYDIAGGNPQTIKTTYGKKVNLPTPSISGINFSGWYKDKDYTKKVNLGKDKYTADDTFYSKPVHTSRTSIHMPKAFVDDIEFKGWYLDEECTKKANIKKMGSKNVTLYAKWGHKKRRNPYPFFERRD